jgi:hypothetical protein
MIAEAARLAANSAHFRHRHARISPIA